MTEPQSQITDEHRSLIGKTSSPRIIQVTEENATRMRDVLEDTDQRWADGSGVAAPYVIASLASGPTRRQAMPSILPNGLMTTQEWRFTRPFQVGEHLSAVQQVVDIRDRLGGRYGYSVLITTSTDYYDADGEHVAAALVTITQFDPAGAEKKEGSGQ